MAAPVQGFWIQGSFLYRCLEREAKAIRSIELDRIASLNSVAFCRRTLEASRSWFLHLGPSLPLSCSHSRPSFRAYPTFPSRTVLLAGRETTLQWCCVTSQQGSHSLKSVNLVVDAPHNRVEVHCVNVSGAFCGSL